MVKLSQMRTAVTVSKGKKRSKEMTYKLMKKDLQRTFPIGSLSAASSHLPLLHRPVPELGHPL